MNKKFVIVCFLGNSIPLRFNSSEWPLHMTLVPPFIYDSRMDTLVLSLQEYAQVSLRFKVTVTARDLFGYDKNIPVSLISPINELRELHQGLISMLESLGARYKPNLFSADSYNFHVTDQGDQKVLPGATVPISSFSLIDRRVDHQPGQKEVIQTFQLAR